MLKLRGTREADLSRTQPNSAEPVRSAVNAIFIAK